MKYSEFIKAKVKGELDGNEGCHAPELLSWVPETGCLGSRTSCVILTFATYSTSPCLSFLTEKMRIVMLPNSPGDTQI